MRGSQRKIMLLGAVFLTFQAVLVGFLANVMVTEHDSWLVRSYRNRWTFRDTPTERGAIWDRFGQEVLAIDRAEFELLVHYQRFRRNHPVGCAVHGGELLRAAGGDRGALFTYEPGVGRGPREAFDLLCRLPLDALLEAEWIEDDEQRQDLAFYTASMVAGLERRGIGQVRADWREAFAEQPASTVLDAVERPFELVEEFDRRWTELVRLENAIEHFRPSRSVRAQLGAAEPRLFNVLDVWRVQSVRQRLKWEQHLEERERRAVLGFGWFGADDEGPKKSKDEEPRRPREEVLRKVAERVPYDIACAFEIEGARHPGLEMWAAARRDHPGPESLRGILGSVVDMGWVLAKADGTAPDGSADAIERARQILDDHQDDLVLDGGWFSEDFVAELKSDVEAYLTNSLLLRGRKGITGVEATLDDVLSGRPGLRLVQRDRYAREQSLASSLDLAPGRDAALTLDLELQREAEKITRRQYEELLSSIERRYRGEENRSHRERASYYLETALVVMDGRSGDVLALAGHPLRVETLEHRRKRLDGTLTAADGDGLVLRGPAGVNWRGAGDIGSLAKPFAFVEVLEHRGEPGIPDERGFGDCTGKHCGRPHGHKARDGTLALANSCNVWFYGMAKGLGERGVEHGLQRFGLIEPVGAVRMAGGMGRVVAGSAVSRDQPLLRFPPIGAEAWCPAVEGLGHAALAPKHGLGSYPVRKRAIGYDTHASPVHVARAYAGLATGRLPTPSVILGPPRPTAAVDARPETLAAVRRGLRKVIEVGTAKSIGQLQRPGVHGKTGTAEISKRGDNNAWFAGWAETADPHGVLPVFVAVAYWVPDGTHGGDVGGAMVGELLQRIIKSDVLHARYPVAVQ